MLVLTSITSRVRAKHQSEDEEENQTMDSNSYDDYRRESEFRDQEYRRKTRKRVILIGVSVALLLVIILGAVIGTQTGKNRTHSDPRPSSISNAESIQAVCNITLYPDSCYSSIASVPGSNATQDPVALFKLSLQVAMSALNNISSLPDSFASQTNDTALQAALADCKELFISATDRLKESLDIVSDSLTSPKISDLRTWLSATVTDEVTCLDGLSSTSGDVRAKMESAMTNVTRFTSNSLAIATGIQNSLEKLSFLHRKLLATTPTPTKFPIWVSASQRRTLLQQSPNVTVAMDGTGQFKTINAALELVPNKNKYPFVIYIKAGLYIENVVVDKNMWNVTMIGDGMYKTIVSGDLNVFDGSTTFRSATVAVVGRGFMARDMGFKNTAGPEKHQAVALRAASDRSVFYRCSFDAYQDTLYVYALRQYYRECDVVGTVDFIFGDAAAVFQQCTLRPRQPLPNQKNTVTAQGRTDPNENTGIAIQGCAISPFGNVTVPTYLGRPWKDYSTTVVMGTEIGEMVDAEGWLEWVDGVLPPSTIYYAEYRNTGRGADLKGRVTWPGFKGMISSSEAKKFSVDSFIDGSEWIPNDGD